MPRPRAKLDVHNQSEELIALHRKEKVGWKRERLLALKLALEGMPTRHVAKELGRSHQTVQDWTEKYRSGGIESLLTKSRGKGAKSKLSQEVIDALSAELEKGQHRTARQVWVWLNERFDMSDFQESAIYYILGKCGGRLKQPRPSNPKKDPEKEAEFKVSLAEKMEALNLPKDRPVRLWVYDEMRYGLHPLTRKVWSKRGVRATAPSRRSYKNGYVYGALQVGGGGCEFLMTQTLNRQWDETFLRQISQRDPYASHVVIGDGAGFHHQGGESNLPENIHIIQLPPYCPELNPVEKLWDIVKDGICNRDWKTMEALEHQLIENLKPYWEVPKKVFSLFTNSYLKLQLNAI